ncbi:MAG TPA: FprA family A-type flavoprotein [Ruminococcaceae bacterium]|nr:FprA family A-type flavoprotein [Oscillospiraceae bacterium]
MKALLAKENIWWVGVLDKDLRVFDIIMRTEYGTTYNSYLVKGKEKTVLFETVKSKFFDEHLAKIKEVCNPAEIDYIVVNHTEPDHSGSIEKMLEIAANATVVGSNMAITFVKEIVNKPFKSMVVTENDKIDIGGMTLNFLLVPQLHWPDSMFTYIPEAKSLFTCDSFGCHYADDKVFNDLITGDFYDAYKYYFDNIMGPFKNPYVLNAIKKIENLDIEFVGNGHGPVLRKDIKKYFDLYREWATPKEKPLSVAICYVSAYGYTKSLAYAIEEGVKSAGIENVYMFDLVEDDCEKAAEAVKECTGFLLGSPTMVADALPPVYQMLIGLNPVIHKGKFAGAFGSYAWSGEAVPNLMARMQQLKFKMPLEGFKVRLKPTDDDLQAAFNYGAEFANAMKK